MKMKILMPVLLAAQTATMVLTTRYTRTVEVEGPRYLSSSVVLVAECVKLFACLLLVFYQSGFQVRKFKSELNSKILRKPMETFKVAIPSGIYALQNNLLFVAISYLDAPTYQITYQLKIMTTAIFSVTLMKKTITSQQWLSLFVLMIGVMCVQYPSEGGVSVTDNQDFSMRMVGFIVLLVACTSSGFAGVYFEYILKSSPLSLAMRNIQMAFFGVIFSAMGAYIYDGEKIAQDGLLQGYNKPVVLVMLLQAFGGLLVSSVVQYTDNLVKVFAASLSLIVSSFVSYFFLHDLKISLLFCVGTSLVLLATFMYGYKPSNRSKSSLSSRMQVKTS